MVWNSQADADAFCAAGNAVSGSLDVRAEVQVDCLAADCWMAGSEALAPGAGPAQLVTAGTVLADGVRLSVMPFAGPFDDHRTTFDEARQLPTVVVGVLEPL